MKDESKQIHLYINNDKCYLIDIEKKTVTKEFNLGNFIITYQNDILILDRTQVSIHHKKVSNINISPKLNHQCDLTIYYDYNIFEIFINNGQYVMSQIVYHINQHILQLPQLRRL